MAIQVRRGLKKDFDPYKMLPGEWAVSIDAQTKNQIVWMCFAAGVVKRMGTYEDFMSQIQEIEKDVADYFYQAFQQFVNKKEEYIQGKVDNDWIPKLQALVTKAEASEKAAANSASAAKSSEDNSKASQNAAATSETNAKSSETNAKTSETNAKNSADASEDYSKLSESWAHGNTGVRSGENTNNSEYFSSLADQLVQEAQKLLEQAQKIVAAATQGALIPAGTITFFELPLSPEIGYMYNISDDFTTDNRFVEGAGVFYRAGANIYWTKDGKWDVMIGAQVTGVKGDAESDYHIGNVNITKENIGLKNVDNTADANKSVKYAASAGSAPASDVYAWAKASSKPSYAANEISGLGEAATQKVANNLTTTAAGSVLDARQGKDLKESIDSLNSNLKRNTLIIAFTNGIADIPISTFGLTRKPGALLLTLQSNSGVIRYDFDNSTDSTIRLTCNIIKTSGSDLVLTPANITVRFCYFCIRS